MVDCPGCGKQYGWERNQKRVQDRTVIGNSFGMPVPTNVREGVSGCPHCKQEQIIWREWPGGEVNGRQWLNVEGRPVMGRKLKWM